MSRIEELILLLSGGVAAGIVVESKVLRCSGMCCLRRLSWCWFRIGMNGGQEEVLTYL